MDTEAIQLIAKAEALEETAKELQFKAAQYRLQANAIYCNLPNTSPSVFKKK